MSGDLAEFRRRVRRVAVPVGRAMIREAAYALNADGNSCGVKTTGELLKCFSAEDGEMLAAAARGRGIPPL